MLAPGLFVGVVVGCLSITHGVAGNGRSRRNGHFNCAQCRFTLTYSFPNGPFDCAQCRRAYLHPHTCSPSDVPIAHPHTTTLTNGPFDCAQCRRAHRRPLTATRRTNTSACVPGTATR